VFSGRQTAIYVERLAQRGTALVVITAVRTCKRGKRVYNSVIPKVPRVGEFETGSAVTNQEASMKLAKEKDPKKYVFLFGLVIVFVWLLL